MTVIRGSQFLMRPDVTPYKTNQRIQCHNWHSEDHDGIRYIYHYNTLMGLFHFEHEIRFDPISVGHGSVSDQQGMNNLITPKYSWGFKRVLKDYGWGYYRNGGVARYEGRNQDNEPVEMR